MLFDVQDFVYFIYDCFGYDFCKYWFVMLISCLYNICVWLYLLGILVFGDWLVQNFDQIWFFVDQFCIFVIELFCELEIFVEVCVYVFFILYSFFCIIIWYVGCVVGYEVYFMVILLYEVGFLDCSIIFVSDILYVVLEKVVQGCILCDQVQVVQICYL